MIRSGTRESWSVVAPETKAEMGWWLPVICVSQNKKTASLWIVLSLHIFGPDPMYHCCCRKQKKKKKNHPVKQGISDTNQPFITPSKPTKNITRSSRFPILYIH
jgi:hypothetical protein